MGQAKQRKEEIAMLKSQGAKSKPAEKSNISIAKEYAQKVYDMTNPGGKWLSTNLHTLSKGEQYAVLKVYESIWQKVDYDAATGAVICHKGE